MSAEFLRTAIVSNGKSHSYAKLLHESLRLAKLISGGKYAPNRKPFPNRTYTIYLVSSESQTTQRFTVRYSVVAD